MCRNRKRPALKPSALSALSHKFIIDGNSISYGQGTSGAPSLWRNVMLDTLKAQGADTALGSTSLAAPGERILISSGGYPAMISKIFSGGGLLSLLDKTMLNIVFALEGTNELGANAGDGFAAAMAFRSYCLQLRAAAKTASAGPGLQGVQLKIIAQTTLPFLTGTTDAQANTMLQQIQVMNNEMRRSWHEYADVLVDHDTFGEFKLIRDKALANSGVYTRAMLAESPIYLLNSGAATDYVHLGDYGHQQLAASNLIGLRRLDTRRTPPAPI